MASLEENDLARLSPQQRAALETLLLKRRTPPGEAGAPEARIVRVSRAGDSAPLSFAQQRLWFIDQLEPGSPLYNMPIVLRIAGPLASAVLARCLGETVRRHEVLRTVFAAKNGVPLQVIQPPQPFLLPVVDLTSLPESAREVLSLALAHEEAVRPFDLTSGPLLRGVLLRVGKEDHVVTLTMHHIVSDAWSLGVLIREVTALYPAFAANRPSPLPDLSIQYADFAVWQRGWLDREVLEGQVAYWRQRLSGAPAQLDLPGARPRPAVPSLRGAARERRFSPPLLEQLRALGRRESATLFMTLLASLQALLFSRTGAADLVVGTDVAGRDRSESEGLIGFFVNQIPLRADLTGDPTLEELLRRVRQTALEAFTHQDLPFDHLVEALRVERSPRLSPVFQVKLVLQPPLRGSLELTGLTLEVLDPGAETAQLDLHWSCLERGDELWLILTYSTDLYDEPLIDELLDHYESWLRAFAERPEARLGDVAAELAQVEQDRLAERGLELKSKNLGKLTTITEPIEQGFRPSPQQLRAWRLQNDGATSCSLCSLRMEGDLDRRALQRALAATVARHEILRTAFRRPASLSMPLQVILNPGAVSLPEVDFRDLSPEHRMAGLTALLAVLGDPPFVLEQGEGWRAALVQLSPGEHELLLALSAVCADAGAFEPFAAELVAAYTREVAGGSETSEPPLQYADVAEWLNNLLEGEDTEEGLAVWREHWKEHDLEARLALPLPLQKTETAPGPFAPREVAVPVTRETAGALARLAEVWGYPLQVLILTAWKTVIQRGTGRDESLVGVLYPGRAAEALRGVVGPLARFLPIAAPFSMESSLREAGAQVWQAMRKAEQWEEHFDWDHIAGTSHRAGGFPVCFEAAMNNWKLAVNGLRVTPVWRSCALLDSFFLALSCIGEGESLQLVLRYDTRSFRRDAADRLAGRLAALLGSAASRPEAPLSHHPAMAEEELSWWLKLSSAPQPAGRLREGKTLAAVFEEQVDRAPDRLAVVAGDFLSFRELDMRANRLAHHLRAAGAGPEVPVALCLDRSTEAVVAILAVWKAGASYVPLDPTQPAERLAFLLADTEAPILVSDSRLTPDLAATGARSGLRVVRLDEEAAAIALRPTTRPTGRAGAHDLAYSIYTSGSTGRPKGVQVEHRSVLHLLAALEAAVLGPLAESGLFPVSLRASLNAPMIFDASVQQLVLLLAGHALCVVPQDIRADGAALLAFLEAQEVDLLDCTPSQLRLLVDAGLLDSSAGPRIVLTAGEAVDDLLWRRLAQSERRFFFNLYGPTECTVDATFHRIERGAGRPTIGRPLAGYEALLLDRILQPVPPGPPGEICLGGAGLARGYLRRPDLTAERFVPHPFARTAGERLYRTGDLGRHLPNGDLEFLGRLDHQVKIRGFRIELGEIETVLGEQAGVREAVVVAREDHSGPDDRRLVAYVVNDSAMGSEAVLRQALRERLPEYMVPASFVMLPALPLTPNGKVDRKALPAPEQRSDEVYLAPRTPVEEVLCGIWTEVLGVERIGVADQFFELGGHSLLATQVMSRLRSAFAIEMPLRDLFTVPRLADLAVRIEEALHAGRRQTAPPLVPQEREGALPLSFAQLRLWFIDQLDPGSPAYNLPTAVRLRGPLRPAVLQAALSETVRRHCVLRTVFRATPDGEPVQVILPAAAVPLPRLDLSELPEARREEELRHLAREEAWRPFDLARGPLLRAALAVLGQEEHAAFLVLHHIASDGWSSAVLLRELESLVGAFAQGLPSPLPELALQYADFACWQRSWMAGEVLAAETAFWQEQLDGITPELALPTDLPRPALPTFRGAQQPLRLPASLTGRLQALARGQGATLFMTVLAGFQGLLGRMSGQESFAVGTPVAGRNRLQTEGLIGCFVNMLALRADLSGDPPAEELVARVRNTALAAYTHQDVPFEKLVEELQPERSLSHSPLFQVVFVLQNQPDHVPAFGDLRFELLPLDSGTAKFDLTLLLVPDGDALAGVLEHSLDLFDPATAERLAERLLLLLDGLAAEPQRRLAELPLLSPAEQEQLLTDWTGPRLEPRWAGPVHGLFARHAERDPDAPAVLFAGDAVSYGALHRRASALAAQLAALGVGPETLVALAVDSSPEMIVGLFAILEAGGAYLPLDPAEPPERLTRLLADAGTPLVLTQERHRDAFAGCGVHTACLEACPPPEEGSAPLPCGTSFPESAAYVIYTSGSTGRPKGVVAHHGGLASFTRAMAAALTLGPGDRVLQFASLTFDASAVQLFPTLVSGATLVLHPDPRRLSPAEILDLCVETGVTVLDLPAALWRQWVTALPAEALGRTAIRTYLTGGEAVPAAILREWAERAAPGATFLSSYGPTEATVTTTTFQTNQEGVAGIAGAEAPLGRPLPNTRVVLLDLYGQTPPQGTPGELHIGGAGITRGYLHDPGLTAKRFVPDPVSGEPGARLYRTGDLARLLPGGELLFLGRSDHQVKIRGFRIELGEIETVLSSLTGVRQAVVVAREIAGSKALVAYIAGDEPPATAGELRELLRRRLPEHMIPAFFVALPKLPLTPSGKVDRKALPAPEEPSSAQRYVAPRTPVEEILADLWAEVLGIERAGAVDSFFDLGGHSLLATQVVSRLRSTFGVDIPLRDLFEAPRLADLAVRIEVAQRSGTPASVPPLLPLPRQGTLPLSFAQERLWFIDQLEPGSPLYNIPVALRIEGPLDEQVLALCLGEVVRRHEALRTVFPTSKGSPAQVIRSAAPFELPLVDLAGLPERQRESTALGLADEEAGRPFDLAGGPLLRGVLVRLAPPSEQMDHVAALTMHHIVSDGWSMGILVQEIVALYQAFLEQKPSPLPELPIQYADFALWQRSWLHGVILDEQLAYWRRHLEGAPRILDLPLDRPRPARQTFRGSLRSMDLAPDIVTALRAFCRREDATPFMVLLAAWGILLGRHAGQQDVVVGSPIAGRNRVEIEGLIGFFVNTLALRVDLHGMPGFAELVARARGVALSGYAHQDIPFERLVDELAAERDLAASPLFQTVLAFQNAPVQPLSVEGLTFAPVGGDGGMAKFDLTLTLGEGGDQGYGGALEYNTGLFDRATADRLVGHFTTLLAAALAEPQAHVWEIPLLDAAERRELLAWSGAGELYQPSGSLHMRFEEQVAQRPDATALVFAETSLTYRDLNRWANGLAHRLLEAGVAPGARVCLAAERGLGLVAGILGILKAGCAYVPLDPSYPQERLAWMLEDAGAVALVSEEEVLDRLPAWPGRVLPLAGSGGREENPRVTVAPEWPAYVIYTSGSTGRPKGVVVSHANVLRLMDSTQGWFGFGSADVWTLFHSFAFDFSVWELWGALLHGGQLVVVPYLVSRSPEAMLELVERQGVTVLNQTPSAFQVFQSAEAQREEPGARSLRWVIFGGEALEPRSLEGWWRRRELRGLGSPGLVNMYGITETTIHVTWRRLGESEILGGGGSVIGVPLGDLWVHVLDPWGQPVPLGVAGELCVGGAGLSPGYLGLPALTAERFVPDGFAATPGARLYRSGDLGRRRRSGELEFLGRIDQQVKIRGFRIELSEIEAALLRQPGVEAAAVLLREDTLGDRRLVAYVAGPAPGGQELRDRLREILPEHMVPAAFVALADLPLTANGKVDRRALPEPNTQRPWLTAEYVTPRTFAEEVLAAILEQVLGIEQVGIHDNFFALGGDSILSVQVVALARERGLKVDLRDLFQHQTLAELGPRVRLIQGEAEEERSEPLSLVSAEDRVKLPAGVEDAYPLTLLQAGMLFHMDLAPDDPPYHNVDSWHLRAPFAQELFEKAVARVLARHPVLRTSFDLTGYSEPLQLVHRRAHLPVPAIDLTALDLARHDEVLRGFVAEEKRRLHDRGHPPQLRFHVHLRTPDSFQFTLTENHAILDGWSLHSTLSEIFSGYFALLAGEDLVDEAPPSATFRDFVQLERLALKSAGQRRFWEERLRDAPRTVLPPADGPVPAGPRLGTADLFIPPPITARLRRLAAEVIVPLKSVLLAAHLKVMALVSGEREVLTGLTSHGRPETIGGEAVRGLFLNVLPFRFAPGEGTWEDLVRDTFQAELEMLPFRRYPMAALQIEQSGPLFETAFNYLHFHVVEDLLRSGDVEVLDSLRSEGNTFALSVTFTQNPLAADLILGLEHDRRRLSDARARWWLAELYQRVLAAMATHASEHHAAACLLAENERHQLLAEWNDTAVSRSPGHFLHGLFRAQAARTPDAPAMAFEGRAITYAELDRLTDRLAGHLHRLGVRPDVAVGVLMERSAEMVVALLGILKAGGGYLPLDPEYPRERLAWMIDEARVPVLLAQRRLLPVLPSLEVLAGCRVLLLEEGWNGSETEEGEAALPQISDGNLAYVLYTSGSTGRPKGVMIPHRGIVNRLLWMQETYDLTPNDRVLQKTPYSFDVSVWEFFWPLFTGACLVVAPPGAHRDSAGLAKLVEREGITVMHFVPSMLQAFLEEPDLTGCAALRLVVASGEALTPELRRRFLERLPARLENLYGPTEASVDVTTWSCAEAARRDIVPIGRPVANTWTCLFDPSLQLVPVGVAGELYIGGAQLARGYWNRPELTADHFVPDPGGGVTGGRLYRTGDLARHLPDGAIEFLGRIDHQVKIRGFRIELGEIEAALLALSGVGQAVVVAREIAGSKALVAYIAGEEPPARAVELRELLRRQLPEHMIPASFVVLARLPLTPNGKVDRKALPAPELQSSEKSHLAPRTPVEEVLAGIWAEVLGLERVGADDHFFDLGGHSLLATQVMSRLRRVFGIEVPLRDLFAAPRLADLAGRVEEALRTGARQITPPLLPQPREGALPLSFAQQRLWFIDQLEPGSSLYNMPVAFGVEGPLDRAVLALCLSEIVRRHEALRTVFTARDGAPVQVVQPTEPFLLPMVDLSGLPETTREVTALHLVGDEAGRAFDLTRGPMLRGVLLRMAEGDHVAAFTMHHIASDGWSMGILVREVAALYPAFAAGRPSPLPELPVQYADFSVWQRSWLSGEALDDEIAWWRRQLAGLPPLLELPTDRPRPAVQSFRGATRPVRLPAGLTRQLEALARREGATLFMVLLTGFQALLARSSGQADLALGSPIAGRNRVEIEDLIGFFVNTLVLRGDLTGEPSFRELLGRVRETALATYLHQDVPFEKLVDDLAPERSLAQTPLFQVMLVLQNAPLGNLEIEDLRLRPVSAETATTKFDLTLSLGEHGGGLSGEAEHATDLFDGTTIDRLVGHFEKLLAAALETPERRVAELPLTSEAERAQILVEWNDTGMAAVPRAGAWSGAATAPAGSGCLHELFETQVARTPEATALIAGEERWTYDALNRRANRLAHYLRRLGAGPEQRVGVMMRRSAELVAALLAVLKAGAAYVPLDPAYPDHWRTFAAEDARITFLLTEAAMEETSGESEQNLQRLAVPGNLAYVLYTSGSTGRPKGVAIEHRAPVERMLWARDAFSAAELAGVLAATSVCFDLSVFEIFAPLSWGGTVILADHALALPVLPAREEVTLLNTVPSVMVELASGALPPRLHRVNLAGEALPPALVERIYRHEQVEQVCNLYGPTEDATYSTWARVGRGASRVSIGRPLPGTRAYVLDRDLQPVPVGVVGELYLAGAGGARGYLGRPELTAERFLPNPFTAQPGDRLYRTGDLARWLAAGELEHLGRLDHQVKVRGFRIELGEIEAALRQHPEVRDVVVLAREDIAEDKRLAAYLVAASAAEPQPDAWRIFLEERLPGSMIPSYFVVLDALPLLPNGKVDRQALPAPSGLRSGAGVLFVAPRTAGEEVLAAIWSEVLSLDRVGVADNFFSLGGHSLLATRVMARLRSLFGVDIPLRLIFEHPTVESLLASIKRLAGDERTVEEVASVSRELDRMSDQEVARILSEP